MEGWKDGSAGGMEGWDGPSQPPYLCASPLRLSRNAPAHERDSEAGTGNELTSVLRSLCVV